eukprot:CAMPEP_0179141718 /NCGR_PEP_ID=MMETSP0796-20121207/68003_1 /TAXON_ID=73915 /ORGANISM="Pyrodinium bahamense, Strain pbaha01" /LENGTH=46 /DNA_ID= /DNA_START= /DNA_END= /DNA_ORIENTATION=
MALGCFTLLLRRVRSSTAALAYARKRTRAASLAAAVRPMGNLPTEL